MEEGRRQRVRRQYVENPDPDYDQNDEIVPRRSTRRLLAEEAPASLALSEQLSVPSWSSEPKRNRGKRKRNKLSKAIYVVTGINKFGAPIEPAGINARWRNDCGTIAREKCKIIWDNWKVVDNAIKDLLWDEMKQIYLFPPEMQEIGKKATIDTIGNCLRTFRCNLNKDYVKKGLTPFAHFEFITPEEWRIFVGQKTTKRALALSKKFSDLSKKNKFSHNLGPGGYQAKISKWRKKEQEDREAGKPDELDGCSDRTRNWILGRCGVTEDGQLVPKNSEVRGVVERAKDIAAKEKEGKFKPNGQNDQLTAALGTEEHRGRTRAVFSRASWRLGFPDDASSDKKPEQPIEDRAKEDHEKWKQNFFQFIKENPQYVQPVPVPEVRLSLDNEPSSASVDKNRCQVDNTTERTPGLLHVPIGRKGNTVEVAKGMPFIKENPQCVQLVPVPEVGLSLANEPSSTSVDKSRCQADNITERTPCSLHVPIGRKGNTVEVAKGIVMPCRIFHNIPIPPECAKVLVLEVVHGKFSNDELDYPLPDEGIKTLGDAVNNFVLWHKQDIILHMQSPVAVKH